MNKTQNNRYVIGLIPTEQAYTFNGVKYVVESKFQPFKAKTTIGDCVGRCITGDFVSLTECFEDNTVGSEYVCPAAGKE